MDSRCMGVSPRRPAGPARCPACSSTSPPGSRRPTPALGKQRQPGPSVQCRDQAQCGHRLKSLRGLGKAETETAGARLSPCTSSASLRVTSQESFPEECQQLQPPPGAPAQGSSLHSVWELSSSWTQHKLTASACTASKRAYSSIYLFERATGEKSSCIAGSLPK